jgi:cytochrome b pre-mRNA-processing protein 3
VVSVRIEGDSEPVATSTSLKAAQELKKVAPSSTETYTAYGATEVLYKECARQADYTIQRAKDEDEEPPKTKDGEDLGVGEGWWNNGELEALKSLENEL